MSDRLTATLSNITHHAPSPAGLDKILKIRAAAAEFARVIDDTTPECRESGDAFRYVELAVMRSVQSVVVNDPDGTHEMRREPEIVNGYGGVEGGSHRG